MSTVAMNTVKDLCGHVYKFVKQYEDTFGSPPKLRILAAKYNRSFTRAGAVLVDALKDDSRFNVILANENGGYLVSTVSSYSDSDLENLILNALHEKSPLPVDELLLKLKGSGYTHGQLSNAYVSLVGAGTIIIQDQVITLLDWDR